MARKPVTHQITGLIEKGIISKRLAFSSKMLVLLLIILTAAVFSGFKEDTAAVSNSHENNRLNYTIAFKSSGWFGEKTNQVFSPFDWSNQLSFNILTLNDMKDKDLMNTAESSILDAMTSWIGGRVSNAYAVDLSILCHSNRYLSFLNSFTYKSNRYDYINDYITIDMQTGKRVMLDDLVEVNEDFVRHIMYGDNLPEGYRPKSDTNDYYHLYKENFESYDPAELLEMLEGCSLTNEQVAEAGYLPITESIGDLIFRNSFYVKEGVLVFMLSEEAGKNVEFPVDEIEEFLKVEKW